MSLTSCERRRGHVIKMRKLRHQVRNGFLIVVLAIAATGVWVISRRPDANELEGNYLRQGQNLEMPTRATPEARWEPIFFKAINDHTSQAKIPELRTVLLTGDDFEIRVWVGFGINGVDGIILRHSSHQWTAVHLHGMSERPPFVLNVSNLEAPRSGWEVAWQRLTQAGILTLPDASVVGCNTHRFDGTNYVVEINEYSRYRTYLYDNPTYSQCAEARQTLKIGEILAEEFNLREFKIGG